MSETHVREQVPFPVQEDVAMSRYIGQHFTQPTSQSGVPSYNPEYVYRRPWLKIAATASAILIAASGGFGIGRITAPEKSAEATSTTTNAGDGGPSNTASPSQSADALVTQGLSLHSAGKVDEAVTMYEQALKQDPKNKFALFNLGQIAHTKGQYDSAIARYKAALETDPKFSNALYNLGLAYAAKGDKTNAIATLRTAAEVTPNSAPTLFNLGTLLVQEGKTDEGAKFLNQAFTIDPSLKPKS
jgi:tetratricopeptide (TPR) repeat protein